MAEERRAGIPRLNMTWRLRRNVVMNGAVNQLDKDGRSASCLCKKA